MTKKQVLLIDTFINALLENEKQIFRDIINYFSDLGYIPQRKKATDTNLTFVHNENGKIIAKTEIKQQKGALKIKFFACKDVPEKYINALRDEFYLNEQKAERNKQGKPSSLVVPPPDQNPLPSNAIMKNCTLKCGVCTGGKMRYYLKLDDGKEIFRCSAYPVLISNISDNDMNGLKRIILEQHNYFLSIT
ncbi:MAG: hypothetical protein FWF08_08285 [Oscillospiraceae bacterium]|nr:hypothetical protein [Oscillospiraceae bacterium]